MMIIDAFLLSHGNIRVRNSLICSFHQITQINLAAVSDSLRLLRTNLNEWIPRFFWANRSFALLLTINKQFAHSLFFHERCERMAQVAYYKWAMLVTQVAHQKWENEQIASFLSEFLIRSLFSHFFATNERFAQKTDEPISNPGYYQQSSAAIIHANQASRANGNHRQSRDDSKFRFIIYLFWSAWFLDIGGGQYWGPASPVTLKYLVHILYIYT